MQYYVRAGALSGYHELVLKLGGNPITLLEQAGFVAAHFREPDNMVAYQKVASLLELTASSLNAPLFALQLGLRQGLRTLGLIGAHLSQQNSIAEALVIARKYTFMHVQGVQLEMATVNAELCEVKISLLLGQYANDSQVMLLSVGLIYRILHDMAGPNFKLHQLSLMQPPVIELSISQLLGCKCEFSATKNALSFSSKVLAYKPIRPDNLINEIITKQFQLNNHSINLTVTDLVKHGINMLLPTGDCNKENIARNLNIHPKKLERQLKEEGTNFRELLMQTRKKITLNTLQMNNMPLTTLALNLGYAEFSVFSRSFKQWFGLSPRVYKSQLKNQHKESIK